MIISIAVFLIITLGLGSAVNLLKWKDEDSFERLIVTLSLGISFIPAISIIFVYFRIPLDYRIFFFLAILTALIESAVLLIRKERFTSFKEQSLSFINPYNIGIIILFGISLWMYLKGSFSYPGFEDHDPWHFTSAAKYVSVNKTYVVPFIFDYVSYPYPQAYQIIMGLLNQTIPSLNWVMKFFNSLFTSLSIPLFYFTARKMLSSKKAAFFAAIALASIPAWLTHFIFAYNLNMVFMVLFFYALLKTKENPKWQYPAMIVFASIWVTHFYSTAMITLMFLIYYLIKSFSEGDINKPLIRIGTGGFLISLIFFWIPAAFHFKKAILIERETPFALYIFVPIRMFIQNPLFRCGIIFLTILLAFMYFTDKKRLASAKKALAGIPSRNKKPLVFFSLLSASLIFLFWPKKLMPLLGTGSMKYSLNQFLLFFPIKHNLIQNPFGIGTTITAMSLIGFIFCLFKVRTLFSQKNRITAIIFTWCIFTFLAVNSAHFSINFMPFRVWAFFAFSLALMSGKAYSLLILKWTKSPALKKTASVLLVLALFFPWYTVKFKLNTNPWKDSYLITNESKELYTWVQSNLPKNSKVYSFGIDQCVPIGLDMVSYPWDAEIYGYVFKDFEQSIHQTYKLLKSKGYQYAVVDSSSILFKYNYVYTRPKYSELSKTEKATLLKKDEARLFSKKNQMEKIFFRYFKPIKKVTNTGTVFQIM